MMVVAEQSVVERNATLFLMDDGNSYVVTRFGWVATEAGALVAEPLATEIRAAITAYDFAQTP
jgi:hypothetical protein